MDCVCVDKDPAPQQHGKKDRGEKDTDRVVAAQKGYGDSDESVVCREAVVVTITVTEHFIDSDHAGQPTRNSHRQNNLFANRNAAVFCGCGVRARRANFISPLGLPQQDVDKYAGQYRQNKSDIQRDAFGQSRNKFSQTRNVRAGTNRNGLQDWIAGSLVVVLSKVTDQRDGYKVEHDRVDDFMRSKPRLQQSRDPAPNCPTYNRGQTTSRQQ